MSGEERAVRKFLNSLSKTRLNRVRGYVLNYNEAQKVWDIYVDVLEDSIWCDECPTRLNVKVMYDIFIRGYEEEKNVP
jgi:hypothetical protein